MPIKQTIRRRATSLSARIQQGVAALLAMGPWLANAELPPAAKIILGSWQCQGQLIRPEGKYRTVATTMFKSGGQATSAGQLFVYNRWLDVEVPLAFAAEGSWAIENRRLTGKLISGDITTGVSWLEPIADLLEQQAQLTPLFNGDIQQLNADSLVIANPGQPDVRCSRRADGS